MKCAGPNGEPAHFTRLLRDRDHGDFVETGGAVAGEGTVPGVAGAGAGCDFGFRLPRRPRARAIASACGARSAVSGRLASRWVSAYVVSASLPALFFADVTLWRTK